MATYFFKNRSWKHAGKSFATLLTFLRESDIERHYIIRDVLLHVFGQPLLLDAIFVQCRHEVRQGAGHAELYLELATREY